jgi:multicomponent Na+:H+ antiporter subunit F
MTSYFWGLAAVVACTLFVGLWRALAARRRADAMLSGQLAGTAAVATLLLSGPDTLGVTPALDLAIVAAALAAVTVTAFVAFGWESPGDPDLQEDADRDHA